MGVYGVYDLLDFVDFVGPIALEVRRCRGRHPVPAHEFNREEN
jgi:hypothetical protein